MADNTEEEHLDSAPNVQPENAPEDIIAIPAQATIPQNQETENMEVHKHPHHITHKKKWGEYLLEFFMLFLAVFLGFLVENFREHRVEKERGEEYVRSFREDLCKDTAAIVSGIQQLASSGAEGDSLRKMIQEGRTKLPAEIIKMYQYNINSLGGFLIPFTDRTEAQLKNSGGMRLITNKKVVDGIVGYWSSKEGLQNIEKDIKDLRLKAREKSYFIFDNKFYPDEMKPGAEITIRDKAQLLTNDYTTLTEFGNRVNHIKNISIVYIRLLKAQHEKADSLIAVIDEEF
jgi:hypothetical protein